MTPEAVRTAAWSHLEAWCGPAPGPVAIAVSGGGDSIALLKTVSGWAKARGRALHVLTVDHGLRAAAREEAGFVAGLAAALGHACRTLTLSDLRPVQAETRLARQRVLAKACREAGAEVLLTGHTLDDQLETFLMRLRQGSGVFGLGGIDRAAPSPVWPEGRGLTLVRPFLSLARSDLRAALQAEGQDWRDDPSNEDTAYERVRMRRLLASDASLADRTRRLQAAFGVLRRAEQAAMAVEAAARLAVQDDGSVLAGLGGLRPARAERLLALGVQLAAGAARMPRRSQILPVLEALDAPGRRFTCSGAWLEIETPGRVRLARDPGLAERAWLDGVWDGRFERAGTPACDTPHPMAARSLPEEGEGWRALGQGRLARICDIWRRMSLLSQ